MQSLKWLQLRNVVLCFCIFLGSVAFGGKEAVTEKEKGEKALQLINHFSTVLYRITDSRDLGILELEYDRISQENIFLDVIEDEETIAIIQQIMTYITKQRLNSEERDKLQKWLKEDMKNAVFKTCPNPTGLISANPKVIATVVSQFAFSWYFHYVGEKKRLEREFEKQEWELDKDKAIFLNERNQKLLEMYWRLVKKYDIKDAQRISTDEIKEFLKYADDKNLDENLVYKALSLPQNHNKYKKFPEYWYRLGCAAERMNKRDEAISAYRQYQSIYLQFLRKDHMAAEVALNLAKLLMDSDDYKKADMMEQLRIIENNVNADDWSYLLFCGNLYIELGEYQLAYQVLAKAVHEQERLLSFDYNEFIEKLKDEGDLLFYKFPQLGAYPLMMCRSAYLQAFCKVASTENLGREFSEICGNKMTSGFETMTYAGSLCRNLPVAMWTNLYDIVAYPDGSIDFRLPMNWFYLGNESMKLDSTVKPKKNLPRLLPMTLTAYYTTGGPEVYTEDVEDREFRYKKDKKTDKEDFWVNVEIPFKHKYIAKRNIKRIELALPLRDLSVTLVYMARPNDLQLFPKEEEPYHPTSIIINRLEYNLGTIDERRVGNYEEIGTSIKDFFKNK